MDQCHAMLDTMHQRYASILQQDVEPDVSVDDATVARILERDHLDQIRAALACGDLSRISEIIDGWQYDMEPLKTWCAHMKRLASSFNDVELEKEVTAIDKWMNTE
jgi:hypothetical protein